MRDLAEFYAEVDRAVKRLSAFHSERLRCGEGCAACCIDGITVFEIEAANIRSKNPSLLAESEPRPVGACAFLDPENRCRIYDDRPYVCRTQGLPLRWIEEDFEGAFEYRDICELNETDEPIEDLATDECWSIGPFETELARLQGETAGRVALRDLFTKK